MMVEGRGRIWPSLALTVSSLHLVLHSLMPQEARLFHTSLPLLMLDASVWNASLSPLQPPPPRPAIFQALESLTSPVKPSSTQSWNSWNTFRRGKGLCPGTPGTPIPLKSKPRFQADTG